MVTPALSAEEWADSSRNNVPVGKDGFIDGQYIRDEEKHRMAAQCLHEQTFGFTREMGNIVRWAAEIASAMSREPHRDADPERWKRNCRDHMVLLREVAVRIEALLPPEAP